MKGKTIRLEDVRFRFILVGLVNTVAGFGIFTAFYYLFNQQVPYLLILLMSQALAVIFSHMTQRKYVWESKSSYFPELAKFGSSYLLITLVNFLALIIAVENLDLPVLISQYAIGAILILSMYLMQKNWVFNKSND